MPREREPPDPISDLVREMQKELDDLVAVGARTDLMPEAEAIAHLVEANDRLVAKQRHLLQLVCLLVDYTDLDDLDDLDAGSELRLVDAERE